MHSLHVDRSVTYPRGKRILLGDFFAKEVKIRLSREGTRVNIKMLPFLSPLADWGLSSTATVDPNCAVMICISDFINSLSCDTLGEKERGRQGEWTLSFASRPRRRDGVFRVWWGGRMRGAVNCNLSPVFSDEINRTIAINLNWGEVAKGENRTGVFCKNFVNRCVIEVYLFSGV